MKLVRTLIVPLVIALTLPIALGESTAAATALCETEVVEGNCARPFAKETIYLGKAASSVFETSLGTITCASSIEGKLSEGPTAAEKPLATSVTSLTFSSCLLGGSACTVTPSGLPYSGSLLWTGGDNGTLTMKAGGAGPIKATVKCGFTVSCTIEAEPPLTLDGKASNATLAASKAKLTTSGLICPKEAIWSATYTLSAPGMGKMYVGSVQFKDRLCWLHVNLCNDGTTYLTGTVLDATVEGEAKFTVTRNIGGTPTDFITKCPIATLKAKTLENDGVKAEITDWKFTCDAPCSVTVLEGPFSSDIYATAGPGTGMMTAYFHPTFQVDCGVYKCTYKSSSGGIAMPITGGEPAKLGVSALLDQKTAGDANCEKITYVATYKFTKPETGGKAKMWVVAVGLTT